MQIDGTPEPCAIAVQPVAEPDLRLLEQRLPRAMPGTHRARLETQEQGEGLYLVAWQDGAPIGHALLKWSGGEERGRLQPTGPPCAHLSDLGVRPDRRSHGIGSHLLQTAEDLARQKGFTQMGLSVGVENLRARALYERLGYREAGSEKFTLRWPYRSRDGREGWEEEVCTYLVKEL